MNRSCLGVDTDGIGYKTALKVLVLRYAVNGSCLGVDTDGISCETALKVPVSRYIVNRGCFGGNIIGLIVKLLCQCLCQGT